MFMVSVDVIRHMVQVPVAQCDRVNVSHDEKEGCRSCVAEWVDVLLDGWIGLSTRADQGREEKRKAREKVERGYVR
jgi:hypothetical protein